MDKKKKKIPTLRFPEFVGEWERKRIGEITDRISDPVNVENEKLYQQIGIRSHGKGLFHKELVTGKSLGNKRVFWVKKGMLIVNIVFAWEQAVAKTTEAEPGMIASHRFPMYQPVNGVLYLDFILYFFLTRKGKYLLEMASPGGAGRNKTLGQKEFERLMINLPGYHEQQKIADFLTAVDDKINRLTRKKTLLEQYKKGVMQKIFSQEIRFKDDEGKDFPEWEVKRLGEVADIKRGASPRPITSPIWFDENSTIGWVRISDVTNSNKFLERTKQYLSGDGVKKSRLVKEGNLIMSICATIGKPIYTNFDVCIHDGFVVFENLQGNKEFVYYYLEMIQIKWYKYGQPGTQVNLNSDIVSCEPIPFPTLPEQQKIADFLTGIDKKIELVNTQLEKTREWKRGLLQQMFV